MAGHSEVKKNGERVVGKETLTEAKNLVRQNSSLLIDHSIFDSHPLSKEEVMFSLGNHEDIVPVSQVVDYGRQGHYRPT